MKNRLKEILGAGRVAVGAQLRFGSPAIAELFAIAGFGFLVIDAEHAPRTPVGVQAQLQVMSSGGVPPVLPSSRKSGWLTLA